MTESYPRIVDALGQPALDVPDLRDLTVLDEVELVDRTDHFSGDGVEVRRTYSIKPYRAFRDFIGAMEGSVKAIRRAGPGDAGFAFERQRPHLDPYTKTVWSDAIVNPIDSDGVSTSITFGWPQRREALGDDKKDFDKLRRLLVTLDNTPLDPRAEQFYPGALVTGIYRPLVTLSADTVDLDRDFDWLDGNPTFTPGSFTLPVPTGLRWTANAQGFQAKDWENIWWDVIAPKVIPTMQITIKRSLVGELLPALWDLYLGKVNGETWNPNLVELPEFTAETLRFDSWTPIRKTAVFGDYWDVILNFTQINLRAPNVQNRFGKFEELDWVTWNHVLMKPRAWVVGAIPLFAEDMGWYRPVRVVDVLGDVLFDDVIAGKRHTGFLYETLGESGFDRLFELNP